MVHNDQADAEATTSHVLIGRLRRDLGTLESYAALLGILIGAGIFKVTGEDTNGAFDYFIVEVAPHGGPPLHVHHFQEETIHVLKGRFKIRIGDSIHYVNEGGFAYLPSKVPHAFLNTCRHRGAIVIMATHDPEAAEEAVEAIPVEAAVEEAVPADVLTAALYTRFRSRQEHTFAEKLLSAMRFKFGGHVERPAGG